MHAGPLRPLALLVVLLAAGCLAPQADDGEADAPAAGADAPLAPVPAKVTRLEHLANVPFEGGNDLAFREDLVYVASFGDGARIIDVADPRAPRVVAHVPCNAKDLDVVDLPKGRRIMTLSSQTDDACPGAVAQGGIRLVDVTNPAEPVVLEQVPLRFGSHTHTPYGNTGLLMNSAYQFPVVFAHHRAEFLDITDPEDPKVVGEFEFPPTSKAEGCHDILALPELDKAVCPGIHETMIWDMSDPLKPKILSTIEGAFIHHSAAYSPERKILIVGDEFAGVLSPACPNAQGKTPTGALFFHDVSDWTTPRELGFYSHPMVEPGRYCSAHNFGVVPGRDLVVGGFYGDGTILVDFSDPANPKMVDRQMLGETSSWASYHHRGLVFSGDGKRGLDVYALT